MTIENRRRVVADVANCPRCTTVLTRLYVSEPLECRVCGYVDWDSMPNVVKPHPVTTTNWRGVPYRDA